VHLEPEHLAVGLLVLLERRLLAEVVVEGRQERIHNRFLMMKVTKEHMRRMNSWRLMKL